MSFHAAAAPAAGYAVDTLPFDNTASRSLPADPELRNFVRRTVPNAAFSRVAPIPIANPRLIAASGPALSLLGLSEASITAPLAVAQLSGSAPIPGAEYTAACYCGHQFGSFSGQLGDGAAMSVGEIVAPLPPFAPTTTAVAVANADALSSYFSPPAPEPSILPESATAAALSSGITPTATAATATTTTTTTAATAVGAVPSPAPAGARARWELQFKGSGPTPYSRDADGRKVLRSTLREYLASEAMFHLGVPTTRAATVIVSTPDTGAGALTDAGRGTGGGAGGAGKAATAVYRDPVYSGRIISEPVAVVTRVAPSFLRFGSLELAKPKDQMTGRPGSSPGNGALVASILHYTLQHHFPADIAFPAPSFSVLPDRSADAEGLLASALPARPASDVVSAAAVDEELLTVTDDEAVLTRLNLLPLLRARATASPATTSAEATAAATAAPVTTVADLRRMYLSLVLEATARTARLVALWQKVGFTHGVLNTDNISLLGLTLDYGPYGWQDAFNDSHVPNGSDHDGRYDWKGQAEICQWNCEKLAEALSITPLPLELLSAEAVRTLAQARARGAEKSESDADADAASMASAGEQPRLPNGAAGPLLGAGAAAAVAARFRAEYKKAFVEVWRGKLGLLTPAAAAAAVVTSPAGTAGGASSSLSAAPAATSPADAAATAVTRAAVPASAAAAAASAAADAEVDEVVRLANQLLYVLHETGADYTLALRQLSSVLSLPHRAMLRQAEAEDAAPAGRRAPASVAAALAGADFAATDDAGAQDNAEAGAGSLSSDPALRALVALCMPAAAYNSRRESLRPEDSEAYLRGRLAELRQLEKKHPKFAQSLHSHGVAINGALRAWAEYNRTAPLTATEKSERDALLWGEWVSKYRQRLARDEATLLAAEFIGPAAGSAAPGGRIAAAVAVLSGEAARAASELLSAGESGVSGGSVEALAYYCSHSPATAMALESLVPAAAAAAAAAVPATAPAAVAARQIARAVALARTRAQNWHNPAFTLRTWAAQAAIEAAEKGDYEDVRALVYVLEDPYDSDGWLHTAAGAAAAAGEVPPPPTTEEEEQAAVVIMRTLAAGRGLRWGGRTDAAALARAEGPTVAAAAAAAATAGWDARRFARKVSEWRRKLSRLPPASASDICVTCSS